MMPGVKGVIPDHRQSLPGQVISHHLVRVFIMPPGHDHVIQATSFMVNARGCRVLRNFPVGIAGKELMEDNLVGKAAAQREGVADHRPLEVVVRQLGDDEFELRKITKNKVIWLINLLVSTALLKWLKVAEGSVLRRLWLLEIQKVG